MAFSQLANNLYLLVCTFGHPTQVCPQVEIFKICVDLCSYFARAQNSGQKKTTLVQC